MSVFATLFAYNFCEGLLYRHLFGPRSKVRRISTLVRKASIANLVGLRDLPDFGGAPSFEITKLVSESLVVSLDCADKLNMGRIKEADPKRTDTFLPLFGASILPAESQSRAVGVSLQPVLG